MGNQKAWLRTKAEPGRTKEERENHREVIDRRYACAFNQRTTIPLSNPAIVLLP
jgi:hypothetical protein